MPIQSSSEHSDVKGDIMKLESKKENDLPKQSTCIEKPAFAKLTRHHRHHLKQTSTLHTDLDNPSESSGDEYYPKHHQPATPSKSPDIKKLLINLNEDQHHSSSSDHRNKSPRRVERTDTVIYRGPKEKTLLDTSNIETPTSPAPLLPSPIVASSPAPRSPSTEVKYLQLPAFNFKDIVPKSPYPLNDPSGKVFDFQAKEQQMVDLMEKKFRHSAMLELIKTIDCRMMNRHHHRILHSDSLRPMHKQLSSCKINDQNPSPESTHHKSLHHRRSRSKSPPESNHHHRHHHHHHSMHTSHSSSNLHSSNKHKSHHSSNESIIERTSHHSERQAPQPSPVREELEEIDAKTAIKSFTQPDKSPTAVSKPSNLQLEMHALTPFKTVTVNANSSDYPETSASIINTNNPIADNSTNAKITNTANATDNLCVPRSSSIRRQQQLNKHNQEIVQQQVGGSISPAGNQQQQPKISNSPATKNPSLSAVPLHRRSSDSDLSITPKGQLIFNEL